MAVIEFYEKPGCINNTKQKERLIRAGHQIVAKDLIQTVWSVETLIPFFEGKAATECFNPVAPAIKNGEINPQALSEELALDHMIASPILIKRPLLNINGQKFCGWDEEKLSAVISLEVRPDEDIVTCPSAHTNSSCQEGA